MTILISVAIGGVVGIIISNLYFYYNEVVIQKIKSIYFQKIRLPKILESLPYLTIMVTDSTALSESEIKALLTIHSEAFGKTGVAAERQNIHSDDEIRNFIKNPNVIKIVTFELVEEADLKLTYLVPVGFGLMSQDLDEKLDIIDPLTFKLKFPQEYEDGRLLYIPVIAIEKNHRKRRAIFSLIMEMVKYCTEKDITATFSYSSNLNPYLPELIIHIGNHVFSGTFKLINVGFQNYVGVKSVKGGGFIKKLLRFFKPPVTS